MLFIKLGVPVNKGTDRVGDKRGRYVKGTYVPNFLRRT